LPVIWGFLTCCVSHFGFKHPDVEKKRANVDDSSSVPIVTWTKPKDVTACPELATRLGQAEGALQHRRYIAGHHQHPRRQTEIL
jgi:hypothetical protein